MAPASSSSTLIRRPWTNLADGPAAMIAERLLAHGVAEYVRFRAVCGAWRLSTADLHAHGGLDRRFHPWRWIMLHETHGAAPDRRSFLNLSTGECIQVRLPELVDHAVLAQTCEGLLVLLHRDRTHHVRLLNPLTRHLTQLPPITTLLPEEEQDHHLLHSPSSDIYFGAWGSGVLDDKDSTVVLSFNSLDMLGVAKPGDARWTLLRFPNSLRTTSCMFAGRFYCVTEHGVMVLKNHPPRLEVAANLRISMNVSPMADSVHLVENAGELMLVHRRFSRRHWNKRRYDVYRVDLDDGTLCQVRGLGDGGHSLFLGMRWSLSVPVGALPAGSISADTVYLRFDINERDRTEGCHLADRTIIPAGSYDRLVEQPHTLVDCLSVCDTGRL
ncbi:hypothetical protein ACQ4PT_047123 [Festuca glaucescens]